MVVVGDLEHLVVEAVDFFVVVQIPEFDERELALGGGKGTNLEKKTVICAKWMLLSLRIEI